MVGVILGTTYQLHPYFETPSVVGTRWGLGGLTPGCGCRCAQLFTEALPATNRALTRRERPFARFDLKSGAEDPLPPAQDTVEPAVDLSSRLPSLPCPYY